MLEILCIILGRYACQIKPRPSTAASQSQISTSDVSVVVMATMLWAIGQSEIKAAPLSIPYIPAFYLYNTEIHVSTQSPVSSVRLSTTPPLAGQVQVTAHFECFISLALL